MFAGNADRARLGLNIEKGIYIANVDEEGPAYKNGLRLGCVITQVDGKDINTMVDLRSYIYSKQPGETINVTCVSDKKIQTVHLLTPIDEAGNIAGAKAIIYIYY